MTNASEWAGWTEDTALSIDQFQHIHKASSDAICCAVLCVMPFAGEPAQAKAVSDFNKSLRERCGLPDRPIGPNMRIMRRYAYHSLKLALEYLDAHGGAEYPEPSSEPQK